jgi:translation elongation factor EF-4
LFARLTTDIITLVGNLLGSPAPLQDDIVSVGRALLQRMKGLLDRQQFEVVLQAAANGKVIARETLRAMRKDVSGASGDTSRCHCSYAYSHVRVRVTRRMQCVTRVSAGDRQVLWR